MVKDDVAKRQQALFAATMERMNKPWTQAKAPFRMLENVYFVGTDWVSVFLLNTPEGLILIDCAYQEVLYQVIDSIHRLGFDPRNIKKLLLTHGHFDHCGAARQLQEMSGCEIWLGEGDAYFFTQRRDLIVFEDHVAPFPIHHFYDYDTPIEFGGMSIRAVPCPGHTPGTTCLFFDVEHAGKNLTCAIHGGLGINGLSRGELKESGWPERLQREYVENLTAMQEIPVDVVLPSHAGHTVGHDFFAIARQDDGSGEGFIDPGAWKRMLESKLQAMGELMAREREEATE